MKSTSFLARILVACTLVVGLAACKESGPDKVSFTGGGIVKVLDVHVVPSSDSSNVIAATQVSYVLAKIEITNDQNIDWAPDLSHVYLLTRLQDRIPAITSGTTALLGVSNDLAPIKKGDHKDYTVAFRVSDPTVTGNIGYDF